MVENKKGLIWCFIITLILGVIPLFLNSTSKLFSYMLAVFGSALLSALICFFNYRTYRKQLLLSLVDALFFLDIQSKIQVETNNNKLTKNQVIDICSFSREVIIKEFNKIDLLIKGLFPIIDKKLKGLLMDYRFDLQNNYYIKFNDIYLFITTCNDDDFNEIKNNFQKHFEKLITYKDFLEKKEIIRKFCFKGKDIIEDFDIDKHNTKFKEEMMLYNSDK